LDFGTVFALVSGFLDEKGYRYAVIGAVAIAAYGLPRTTVDLDLVVEASAQDDLIGFLESRGYETLHRSSGYSNHRHKDPDWGSLDFVYVGAETSHELFAAVQLREGLRGSLMPLPKPEHLAALKVLAMKNDPSRTLQDMADIRFLVNLPGVDRKEIRSYFDRHGMKDWFDELEKTS
jgi:hypothetical protein